MSDLSDIARDLSSIADDSGNDWDAMSVDQLNAMLEGLQMAVIASASLLGQRCGDAEEAARQIRLAVEMPNSVLARRSKTAEATIECGGLPPIADHAAFVAVMMRHIDVLTPRIERKQSGQALN